MNNVKQILDKLASNSQLSNYLEKATEAYEPKPFAVEYKRVYEMVNRFDWLPSLLSVLSSSLVAVSLFPRLHLVFSMAIGLIVALLLEMLKSFVTREGFRAMFRGGAFNALIIACIGLYCLSVFLSSYGSYNAYTTLKTSLKDDVSSKIDLERDSLTIHYDALIHETKTSAKEYFNQVSWKGKISHKNSKVYNSILEKVSTLESDKKADLDKLNQDSTVKINAAADTVKPYLYILIGFALLNELVIFLFSRFKELYLFKSFQQVNQLNQAERLVIDVNSLGSLAEMLSLGKEQSLILNNSPSVSKIGFQVQEKDEPPKAPVHDTRSTTVVDKLAPRACLSCGKTYKPSVAWQKYCSKDCNHKANNFKLKK